MTDHVSARMRDLLGPSGVDHDPTGRPRITPDSTEAVARALALATGEGWKVRIEGRGSWMPGDLPADLVLSTAGLDRVHNVSAGDLVATIEAGASIGAVGRRLADQSAWLAWDPPGRPERTLGSIVATGTSGPLRQGFGPIRDHLLGCTVVTGDGRILSPGGAVVKNVAGYDLTRLVAGGFGAFGVITELHLRLRALPATDRTVIALGPRDALTRAARDLAVDGLDVVACELLSPALAAQPEWTLAIRFTGTEAGFNAEMDRLRRVAAVGWEVLTSDGASALWTSAARGMLTGAVGLRLGVLPGGLDDTIDLLEEELDTGVLSAGAASGALRWAGDTAASALTRVRSLLHAREIPVTLERGPALLRQQVGHFGRYREGVGPLVSRLREVFDPSRTLVVPFEVGADA